MAAPRRSNIPLNASINDIRISKTARIKKKWQDAMRRVVIEFVQNDSSRTQRKQNKGLITELKKQKAKKLDKTQGGVLSLLTTQQPDPKSVFERQKCSAKEIIRKQRIKNRGGGETVPNESMQSLPEYDRQARLRYQITPAISAKLDKIKAANDLKAKARFEKQTKKPNMIEKMFESSILGQALRANPRFYKMDPLYHLPTLCRRCRRPLADTLESRFTSIGILLCIFLPILGIPLLFANKEFVCVICDEVYVYGDLTARPERDFNIADDDEN